MNAIIYVSKAALATSTLLKELDYYDRLTLSDDEDFTQREGYYLKNGNNLRLQALPDDALISLDLDFTQPALYDACVTFPLHLRGCIFENAPHLPDRYAEIVRFWSGLPVNSKDSGAVYFQNHLNEYMVDLAPTEADQDVLVPIDDLLSEGLVVSIQNLGTLVSELKLTGFVRITLPIDEAVLVSEGEAFLTQPYQVTPDRVEQVCLAVSDILTSPAPDSIYIDLLQSKMIDYGYYY